MAKSNHKPEQFYDDFLQIVENTMPKDYFHKHFSESRKFNLFENAQLQELLSYSPAVVGVFNNVSMSYEYLSDNVEVFTGYPSFLFKGPESMKHVLSTYKEEHAVIPVLCNGTPKLKIKVK
jgi:hypothetical protein